MSGSHSQLSSSWDGSYYWVSFTSFSLRLSRFCVIDSITSQTSTTISTCHSIPSTSISFCRPYQLTIAKMLSSITLQEPSRRWLSSYCGSRFCIGCACSQPHLSTSSLSERPSMTSSLSSSYSSSSCLCSEVAYWWWMKDVVMRLSWLNSSGNNMLMLFSTSTCFHWESLRSITSKEKEKILSYG